MARAIGAQPYLTLDRYRQIVNVPMCVFNGIESPNEAVTGCDSCWSQWEREQAAQALYDAEQMLASHLNFYLGAHYIVEERVPWAVPLKLRWGHVIGAGVQAQDEVVPVASDFTIDPAMITVATADFEGIDEVVISVRWLVPACLKLVGQQMASRQQHLPLA